MARLARVVAPGLPHHVTQRGNRRQPAFFCEDDYRAYLQELRVQSKRWGLQVWAYCLMTNHVHLIVVPETETSLARGLGEAHRHYTRRVHFREGWRGYLWQGRFASVPLDEALSQVTIDLSGRTHFSFSGRNRLGKGKVGTFDVELLEDFLGAFASSSSSTLHVEVRTGRNAHHIIEATFKAFARALRQAVSKDSRVSGVPSTKGVL